MADSTQLEMIERRLDEIEQNEAQSASERANNLVAIKSELQRVTGTLSLSAGERLARLKTHYDALATAVAADLRQRCSAFADRHNRAPDLADADRFERELDEHRRMLSYIQQLAPELGAEPEVARLETQLSTLNDRLQVARRISTSERDVRELWAKVDELDKIYPDQAVLFCKQARDQARALVDIGLALTLDETSRVYTLQRQAEERYDEIRSRHEVPVTKQEGGELVETIVYFIDLAARNPQASVTYFASADHLAQPRAMNVEEARAIAQLRLLRLIWRERVEAYVRSARELLGAHKPREAKAALDAWRQLPGLNDERLGVKLSENIMLSITGMEDQIKPELQQLERAEELLRESQRALNPVRAHQYWQQARESYGFLPDIDEQRRRIVMRAAEDFDQSLIHATRAIEEEDWDLAERRQAEAGELFNTFGADLDTVSQSRHSRLSRVLGAVLPVVRPGAGGRLTPDEEIDRLRELRDEYEGTYWARWSRLQRRLIALEARGDVNALLAEVRQSGHPDVGVELLERLSLAIDELLNHPPQGIAEADLRSARGARGQVLAWVGFARARDELAKLDNGTGVASAGLGQIDAPDLEIVRAGIEQAQQNQQAAQAVRQRRLIERRDELLRHDDDARVAFERIAQQMRSPDLDYKQAERMLREIDQWLGRPTSYRQRLYSLRAQLAISIAAIVEEKINQQIEAARTSRFRDLNAEQIKGWLRTLRNLNLPPEQTAELFERVKLPQRIASLYDFELTARDSDRWEEVRKEWLSAANLAREQDDWALNEYCVRRADYAYRQGALSEIQIWSTDVSFANEQRLEAFTNDPILQRESRIWLEYGKFLLRRVKQEIRHTANIQADFNALERARSAFERAQALYQPEPGSSAMIDIGSITVLVDELQSWQQLAIALNVITRKLPNESERIVAVDCEEARHAYDAQRLALRMADLSELLEQVWVRQSRAVRRTLERQARGSRDLFERLEGILGLITLFPNEHQWRLNLRSEILTAIQQLQRDVAELCDDPSASAFLRRRRIGAGDAALLDEKVIEYQQQEVTRLAGQLDVLKLALTAIPATDTTLDELRGVSLDAEEERIKDWSSQLGQCADVLRQALDTAKAALMKPAQFDRALYMLRQPSRSSFSLPQVPEMFKDREHPTYRWYLAEIQSLQRRPEQQQLLKRKFELCLMYETVTAAERLPDLAQIRDSLEQEVVADLRAGLQRPNRPRYALEVALQYLNDLVEAEPDDACGIQDGIEYHDSHEPGRVYRTPGPIRHALQCKIAQVHAIHRWLNQISATPEPGDLNCPGIVDWPAERARLAALCDRDPSSFHLARKACVEMRSGDDDGLCRPGNSLQVKWPLSRAITALSQQAMLAYVNAALIAGDFGEIGPNQLGPIARSLDQERLQRVTMLETQRQDNHRFEAEISKRAAYFDYARDKFSAAYNTLIERRRPGQRETAAFLSAAEELRRICPKWPDFLEKLERVERECRIPLSSYKDS